MSCWPRLAGPWLLRVGFGAEYLASGALLAWLTAGAVAIAVLTVTGAATVAAALHRAYSVGWVGATVASALLLILPLALETRTVVALLCGPLVGIAVHLGALATSAGLSTAYPGQHRYALITDVWIVVPAFNEASVIGDVVADLRSVFGNVVVRRRRQHGRHRGHRAAGRCARRAAIRSTSVRARPSRPASSTPGPSPVRGSSPPSTPTASTASRTSSR